MDHIHTEYQRDLQPAIFYGDILNRTDLVKPSDVEKASDFSLTDLLSDV